MGEAREIESRSVSEPDALPLAGKTALVSGAAKRIGRASALALAASGANVAITYRDSQAEAEETVRDLAALDVDALAVRTDLGDPESIRETVAAVVEEFGRLDILVNNAGVFESAATGEHHRRAVGRACLPPTRGRHSCWRRRRIRI